MLLQQHLQRTRRDVSQLQPLPDLRFTAGLVLKLPAQFTRRAHHNTEMLLNWAQWAAANNKLPESITGKVCGVAAGVSAHRGLEEGFGSLRRLRALQL